LHALHRCNNNVREASDVDTRACLLEFDAQPRCGTNELVACLLQQFAPVRDQKHTPTSFEAAADDVPHDDGLAGTGGQNEQRGPMLA
jgi:hypothetical protein